MAEQNLVHLYGIVMGEPKVTKDPDTQEFRRITLFLNTMRSARPYQGRNEENELATDPVLVMSQNPEIIKVLSQVHENDMLIVKGTLNTRNVKKNITCTNCGERFSVNATSDNTQTESSMITFLTPICVDIRETGLNEEAAFKKLTQYRSMSNEAIMVGNLCNDVQKQENGYCASYQIGINRKFFLKDDDPQTRADYPYVRVYGEQAEKDFKYLHKGSMVLIDGMIQLRKFTRHTPCPYCGENLSWQNSVLEIVPYATEYLQNFLTPEMYEKMQAEAAEKAVGEVFGKGAMLKGEGA